MILESKQWSFRESPNVQGELSGISTRYALNRKVSGYFQQSAQQHRFRFTLQMIDAKA